MKRTKYGGRKGRSAARRLMRELPLMTVVTAESTFRARAFFEMCEDLGPQDGTVLATSVLP